MILLNGKWETGLNRNYTDESNVPGLIYSACEPIEGTLWYKREITLPEGNWTKASLILYGARIEAPTPYKHSKPMLFYGSSITEGAHATRPSNAYTALVSSHLDIDYYNFGFSGSAKGHLDFAEYIVRQDISIFVLDYDHNAPDTEYLEKTHEPFFKYIRERKPDLPIVITTSPDFDYAEDKALRREIIRKTYTNAVNSGDKNVYFVDGETFFGDKDRHSCTSDTTHPNDLGHYRMAQILEPLIKDILQHQ